MWVVLTSVPNQQGFNPRQLAPQLVVSSSDGMAAGQPPLLKKLVLEELRERVFSDRPAWEIIDKAYEACPPYGLTLPYFLTD